MLSIIIPAYNEAENITQSIEELVQLFAGVNLDFFYEIIVIDDHSTDTTYQTVAQLGFPNVHCIRLSRRSGSHTAIRAGLQAAKGDAALLIAADGQDNMDAMLAVLGKWQNGGQMIWAMRQVRSQPILSKLFAGLFYKCLALLLENQNTDIDFSRIGFFLLDRKVIDAINACSERNTCIAGLMDWVGFKQDFVEYIPHPRRAGKSKWSFRRRINIAKDWVIAFSNVPLRLTTYVGTFTAIMGMLYALFITINALHGNPIQGWSSLMVTILVLGGLQMLMMGVIGEYLSRNLDETRSRPLYFVEESTLEKAKPVNKLSQERVHSKIQ